MLPKSRFGHCPYRGLEGCSLKIAMGGETVEPDETPYKKLLTCCATTVISVAICINCGSGFHVGCLKRRNIQVIDRTRVICCKPTAEDLTSNNDPAKNPTNEQFLKEIAYLERLVKEMESKNTILQENNILLKEKIEILQQAKKSTETYSGKVAVHKTTQPRNPIECTRSISNECEISVNKTKNGATNNSNAPTNPQNFIKSKQLATPQSLPSASQSAGLTDNLQGSQQNKNTDRQENFNLAKSRKRNRKLGTNETSSGFIGVEKRVWIYLHRIQRTVTKANIESYIKNQPDLTNADINIRELPTSDLQNKCFVLDAPFDLKNKLYDQTLWPKGVGIKRYSFQKHRENNKSFL